MKVRGGYTEELKRHVLFGVKWEEYSLGGAVRRLNASVFGFEKETGLYEVPSVIKLRFALFEAYGSCSIAVKHHEGNGRVGVRDESLLVAIECRCTDQGCGFLYLVPFVNERHWGSDAL